MTNFVATEWAGIVFWGFLAFIASVFAVVCTTKNNSRLWWNAKEHDTTTDWYKIKLPRLAFILAWPFIHFTACAAVFLTWKETIAVVNISGYNIVVDDANTVNNGEYNSALSIYLVSYVTLFFWPYILFSITYSHNTKGGLLIFLSILTFLSSASTLVLFFLLWYVPGILFIPYVLWSLYLVMFSSTFYSHVNYHIKDVHKISQRTRATLDTDPDQISLIDRTNDDQP